MRDNSISDTTGSVKPKPPHNIEAEQALLGAILIANTSIEQVGDGLGAEHFFDPLHGAIYDAALRAISAGRPATPISLRDEFEHAEPVGEITVAQYLIRLAAGATTIGNAAEYARIIREHAVRRQLILIGEDMVNGAYDPQAAPPARQVEEAEQRLYALSEAKTRSTEVSAAEMMERAVGWAHEAYIRGDSMSGLSSGLRDLDAQLGGLDPGNLIILAGRPSMGKTAMATNIAFTTARKGVPIGFFSQEMRALELGMRLLGERLEISSHKLRTGRVDASRWNDIKAEAERLGKLPAVIDEAGGLSLATLATRARRWKRQKGIGLLVIDYIQLMRGSSQRGNRVEDVTEITTGLKALAKELDLPIIALSQLSRGPEQRTDKRPQLSDLRESGSIEQDADVVLFVFREDYYVTREEPAQSDPIAYAAWQDRLNKVVGTAEVIIGKQRHGPTGTIKVAFDGKYTRFSDLARDVHHEQPSM